MLFFSCDLMYYICIVFAFFMYIFATPFASNSELMQIFYLALFSDITFVRPFRLIALCVFLFFVADSLLTFLLLLLLLFIGI